MVLRLTIAISLAASLYASPVVLTFEELADKASVGASYSGLTFQGANVLTSGISLNEFEFPPHSGSKVIYDQVGPITVQFSTLVNAVSFYVTYIETVTATAFDAEGAIVGSAVSLYNNNLALSGDIGSHPNELLQLSANSIESVRIVGSVNGSSFTADDFTFAAADSSAPEMSTMQLFLPCCLGLLGIKLLRRKAKRVSS